MKINRTTFHDDRELQQLFQNHLVIGKTTVKDTQEFLNGQRLSYSEEIKQGDKYFNALIKTSDNQSNIKFDSCIGCKIPISPNKVITWNPRALFQAFLNSIFVKRYCLARFYFYVGILTEIDIKTVGIGLWLAICKLSTNLASYLNMRSVADTTCRVPT